MEKIPHTIAMRSDGRFEVYHAETGELLDDAQGYGYKTYLKAKKAAWYHFSGGKAKMSQTEQEAQMFWMDNQECAKTLLQAPSLKIRSILRGGSMSQALQVQQLAKNHKAHGFNMQYLRYLRKDALTTNPYCDNETF